MTALRTLKIILGAVICVFIGTAAYTSVLISERQDALSQISRYNVSWLAAQATSELTRLNQRISALRIAGSGVTEDEVRLRYDILLNRLKLFQNGEFAEFVRSEESRQQTVKDFARTLAELEPLLEDLSSEPVAARALRLIAPLDRELALLASAANQYGGERAAEDRRELLRLHHFFSASVAGLTACGIAFLGLLLRKNTLLRQAHQEMGTLASHLQSTSANLRDAHESLQEKNLILRMQNERFDAALSNMSQGICMVDTEQRVAVCNRPFLELLGLAESGLNPGTPIRDLYRLVVSGAAEIGDTFGDICTEQQSLIREGRAGSYSYELSSGRTIAVAHQPLRNGGWLATYEDVTERRQAEEELRLAKETAEHARMQAEIGSRAKTEFLAAMSHEIRTPLNAIMGFTNLLLDRADLPQEVCRQLDLIKISGATLLTVVNDVLDFSKIEAGAVELDVRPFGPEVLANNCMDIIRGHASSRQLELRVEFVGSRQNVALLGDEARIQQVLLNLLNNAIKFTPAGRVLLRVEREPVSAQQERLSFTVADTGIGIPKEKQHRLFKRFSQVDGSASRQYAGTGLGLAISKSLVDLMHGQIGFSSEPGHGSTFWFSLPLQSVSEINLLAPKHEPPHSAQAPARILLAEDVEINQEIARAVLEAAGHTVDVVSDGAQAVTAVQNRPYDLVLMDVQMPVMDGVTATQHIRALEGPVRDIPIIGMTANVYAEQIASFLSAGMNDHVGKPFDSAALYATIDRWRDPAPRPARSFPQGPLPGSAAPEQPAQPLSPTRMNITPAAANARGLPGYAGDARSRPLFRALNGRN
ncbi:MAG TPA: ATP-binding protein [Microvirga sp.]|nr:ATP-binding protein [Microvirga sp.]